MGFQRNSGWSRESNSTKTGMGSTRPPRLHNRFICSFPPWLGNGSFLMSQGWETHVKWKSSREMSHKNRSFESFLEMCVLFASNWFHLFPFPYSTPGQSRICLLIMWFCTLANVTKNCTLTRNVPQTHWFAIKRLLHNWSWHKPAKLKLQFQSYSIPMRLASTKKHTHTQTWQQGSGLVSNKPCYLHVGVQMWISLMFDFPQKKKMIGILNITTSSHFCSPYSNL